MREVKIKFFRSHRQRRVSKREKEEKRGEKREDPKTTCFFVLVAFL